MKFLRYYLLDKDAKLSDSSENETGFTHKICKKSLHTRLTSYANLDSCNDELSSSVYIGFPINSELFKYTEFDNIRKKNFIEVTQSNTDKLINLAGTYVINTAADIENYIIDKFNNDNLILVTYNDDLKYNKIEELAYLIFNINNKLNKLGKIIKLYIIKNTDNQDNIDINNLEYVNLGEKLIPTEIEKEEHKCFHLSITLYKLINRLTGGFSYETIYVSKFYDFNTKDEDSSCDECFNEALFNCHKCNANKFKKIINDIYAK